jgi:hypothetical protein
MTTTAEQFERDAAAILAVTAPEDQFGTSLCINAARTAASRGDYDTAGALLDEACTRAGIIGHDKLAQLHCARLEGTR